MIGAVVDAVRRWKFVTFNIMDLVFASGQVLNHVRENDVLSVAEVTLLHLVELGGVSEEVGAVVPVSHTDPGKDHIRRSFPDLFLVLIGLGGVTALQAMQNFSSLFKKVEAHLRERGDYYENNTGQFYYGLTNIDFAEEVGTDRAEQRVMDKTLDIFNCVRAQALVTLGTAKRTDEVDPLPLSGFIGRRELA